MLLPSARRGMMTESRSPPISNCPRSRFVKYVDALTRRGIATRHILIILTFDSRELDHSPTSSGKIMFLRCQMWRRILDFLSSKPRLMCIASALLFLGVLGSMQLVYPQEQKSRSPELELLPVQGNISMLAG